MEQQPRKRGRPRLLVTADVVERRKNSKRLQNAKRRYKRGEELSEGGCSAHSPNIAGSRTGDQSSSAACPALDDARLAGHANVEGTSLGPELTRIGAGTGCSNLYESSVTGSANAENATTGPESTTIGAGAETSNLYGSSVTESANTENTTTGLLETPRQRTFIDKKKKAFRIISLDWYHYSAAPKP